MQGDQVARSRTGGWRWRDGDNCWEDLGHGSFLDGQSITHYQYKGENDIKILQSATYLLPFWAEAWSCNKKVSDLLNCYVWERPSRPIYTNGCISFVLKALVTTCTDVARLFITSHWTRTLRSPCSTVQFLRHPVQSCDSTDVILNPLWIVNIGMVQHWRKVIHYLTFGLTLRLINMTSGTKLWCHSEPAVLYRFS